MYPPNSELCIWLFSIVIVLKIKNNSINLCGHLKGMFCMSINCIALGKRICFYRLKFNITQEKLAALTNCSREYIAYLESGTKTPSLPTLIDLANVLHTSKQNFMFREASHSISRNIYGIMNASKKEFDNNQCYNNL